MLVVALTVVRTIRHRSPPCLLDGWEKDSSRAPEYLAQAAKEKWKQKRPQGPNESNTQSNGMVVPLQALRLRDMGGVEDDLTMGLDWPSSWARRRWSWNCRCAVTGSKEQCNNPATGIAHCPQAGIEFYAGVCHIRGNDHIYIYVYIYIYTWGFP